MRRYSNERGAALIMLIGMTAALAILAATLVFVIANQSKATAITRARTQSFYGGEAALDSAVQRLKIARPMPTASGQTWLTQADLAAAFNNQFPPGSTVAYKIYDNVATIDFSSDGANLIGYDSNGDHRMWVDATATAPDSRATKTRERVLIQQVTLPFAAALPKAVTYSDTGIYMGGSSDIYAVNADGSPITDGSMPTYMSAGGTWTPSMSSSWGEVGRLTVNTTANMAGPGATKQTLGIKVNGSVRLGTTGTLYTSAPNHKVPDTASPKFTNVFIGAGTVGFLSDYFDQAAQASLVNEAQEGGTPATAPTAPADMTPVPTSTPDATTLSSWTSTSSTTAVNVSGTDYKVNGSLTLQRNGTTGRSFTFRDLYVTGDLAITGPITLNARSIHVGGKLTITGPTSATVSQTLSGTLYVAGSSASTVKDRVELSAAALYCAGALTINNTQTTSVADAISQIYCLSDFSVSGPVALNAATSLCGAGNVRLNGPTSGSTTYTDTFGLIYTSGTTKTLTFSGNVVVKATGVTANGDFTISGSSTAVTDMLGAVYVAAYSSSSNPSANHGDVNWGGKASVWSIDPVAYNANPASDEAQPKPMWLGRYFKRDGTFSDKYGNIWVPGNSSTSVVFDSDAASTVMCPLLATTEKTQVGGNIRFGSRLVPMVYFFVCDNNGIYPQVVDWTNIGTYFGLMVINESTIDFSGDTDASTPTVEGAVFAGCPYDPSHTSGMSMSDIVLSNSDSIAYNMTVVGNIATSSLKTKTTVTQTLPGSWQQLPVN